MGEKPAGPRSEERLFCVRGSPSPRSLEPFKVRARVSSANLTGVGQALREVWPGCAVREEKGELVVEGRLPGDSAKDLNRNMLSALRRVEKKTRLRAEWTSADGTTERYFDYVMKKKFHEGREE